MSAGYTKRLFDTVGKLTSAISGIARECEVDLAVGTHQFNVGGESVTDMGRKASSA